MARFLGIRQHVPRALLGNGRLGAIDGGGAWDEEMTLNEESVLGGRPLSADEQRKKWAKKREAVRAMERSMAAADVGGPLVIKLSLIWLGMGASQAAVAGLMVEYSRRDRHFGRTVVLRTLASAAGFVAAKLLIGFGQNSLCRTGTLKPWSPFSLLAAL